MRTVRAIAIVLVLVAAGCSTAPRSADAREGLMREADQTLAEFRREDPGLDPMLSKAQGCAVFPSVGKGAWVVGGAYGKGIVYEKGTLIGYCDLTQASVGLQFGGQSYSELIVFQTAEAIESFKSGNFAFAANASATVIKAGAAASAKYDNGVAVFVRIGGGLMVEAAIGGQKFAYIPKTD
jgi:lipid-binding SYLF domain-containing protein